MIRKLYTHLQSAALLALMPVLTGCGGGGGGGTGSLGSLFGGGSSGGSSAGLTTSGGSGAAELALAAGQAAEGVSVIVNPEPATMMLMGGGMATLAYFKSRGNKTPKA